MGAGEVRTAGRAFRLAGGCALVATGVGATWVTMRRRAAEPWPQAERWPSGTRVRWVDETHVEPGPDGQARQVRTGDEGVVVDDYSPISFVVSFAELTFCTPRSSVVRSDRQPPRLVVIAGLPGAGKTTHARALETQLPAVRLCADDWLDALSQDLWDETAREQIERLQWELARRLLALGTSVIIEWGTWSRTERDRIREQGRRLGARLELHYLDAADAQLLARVHERGREQPPISQDQLRAWRERFEVPTRDEMQGWDAVELIRPRTRV